MSTAFPYDPTASAAGNHITKSEEHLIKQYSNKWRCIIPAAAPFYRKDLTIWHKELDRELHEGLDYHLGHRFNEATTVNKMPVFGSVMLDEITEGTLVFKSYRTLGGPYNLTSAHIRKYLSTDFDDPRNCDWADVMSNVVIVPPLTRPTDIESAIELDPVVGALNDLNTALKGGFGNLNGAYKSVIDKLVHLEGLIVTSEIQSHPTEENAHGATPAQIGALSIDAPAKDALKLYGRTLAELLHMLRELGINDEDMIRYAAESGMIMRGSLNLGDHVSLQLGDTTTYVNTDDGGIFIAASKPVTITTTDNQSIIAGNNTLTLHSGVGNALAYNGHYIITAGNIGQYIDSSSVGELDVRTENTATVRLKGNGTIAQRLTGDVLFPTFSHDDPSKPGIIRLTDTLIINDRNVGASSVAANELSKQVSMCVPKELTINKKSLRGPIILTARDLGLDDVENITDTNLPIPTAAYPELAKKAKVGHRHLAGVGDVELATETVKGQFRMSEDKTFATTDAAATAGLFRDLFDKKNEILAGIQEGLFRDSISAVKLGSYAFDLLPFEGSPTYPLTAVGPSHALMLEEDGQLVGIRTGMKLGANSSCLFTRCKYLSGIVSGYSTTSQKYLPTNLNNPNNYTTVPSIIHSASDGWMSWSTGDGKQYLVMLNGTLNPAHHVGGSVNLTTSLGGCTFIVDYESTLYTFVVNERDGSIKVQSWTHDEVLSSERVADARSVNFTCYDVFGVEHFQSEILKPYGDNFYKFTGDEALAPIELSSSELRYVSSRYVGFRAAREGSRCRIAYTQEISITASGIPKKFYLNGSMSLDLVNRTATADVEQPYPVVVDTDGTVELSQLTAKGYDGYGTLWGRLASTVRHRDGVNEFDIYEPGEGQSFYDSLAIGEGEFTITNTVKNEGRFPNLLRPGMVAPKLLPGQEMITQIPSGDYVGLVYDYLKRYTGGNTSSGYGSTNITRNVNEELFKHAHALITTPDYDSWNAEEKKHDVYGAGVILTEDHLSTPIDYKSVEDGFTDVRIRITAANLATLKESIKSQLPANTVVEDDYIVIHRYRTRYLKDDAFYYYLTADSEGTFTYNLVVAKIETPPVASDLGLPTVISVGGNRILAGKIAGIEKDFLKIAQSTTSTTMHEWDNDYDGHWVVVSTHVPLIIYPVGNDNQSTATSVELYRSVDAPNTYNYLRTGQYNGLRGEGTQILTYVGIVDYHEGMASNYPNSLNGVSYHLSDYLNAKYRKSGKSGHFLSPEYHGGWVLGITDTVEFFHKDRLIMIPPTYINLDDFMSGGAANTTYYITLRLDEVQDKWLYVLYPQSTPPEENEKRHLIGKCVTDDVGIIDIDVSGFCKLGLTPRFSDHINPQYADKSHGHESLSPALVDLGSVRNYPVNRALIGAWERPVVWPSTVDTVRTHLTVAGAGDTTHFIIKRLLWLKAGTHRFEYLVDDNCDFYVDGVKKFTCHLSEGGDTYKTFTVPNDGIYTIAMHVRNTGSGPVYIRFNILHDDPVVASYNYSSNCSWSARKFASAPSAASVTAAVEVVSPYNSYITNSHIQVETAGNVTTVLHGTATDGTPAAVPYGFSASDCRYIITPTRIGIVNPGSNGIHSLRGILVTVENGMWRVKYLDGNLADFAEVGSIGDKISFDYICIATSGHPAKVQA